MRLRFLAKLHFSFCINVYGRKTVTAIHVFKNIKANDTGFWSKVFFVKKKEGKKKEREKSLLRRGGSYIVFEHVKHNNSHMPFQYEFLHIDACTCSFTFHAPQAHNLQPLLVSHYACITCRLITSNIDQESCCQVTQLQHKAYRPDRSSGTVAQQTDFDVSVGQCLVSDRNLAGAILIRHKTLSDGEVKGCLSYDSA